MNDECINYVSHNFSDLSLYLTGSFAFPNLFYRLLLLLPFAKAVDLNRLGKKLPCRVNIFETENKTSAALPTVGCASSTLITVAQVGRFEFLAGITKNAKSRNRRRRRRW